MNQMEYYAITLCLYGVDVPITDAKFTFTGKEHSFVPQEKGDTFCSAFLHKMLLVSGHRQMRAEISIAANGNEVLFYPGKTLFVGDHPRPEAHILSNNTSTKVELIDSHITKYKGSGFEISQITKNISDLTQDIAYIAWQINNDSESCPYFRGNSINISLALFGAINKSNQSFTGDDINFPAPALLPGELAGSGEVYPRLQSGTNTALKATTGTDFEYAFKNWSPENYLKLSMADSLWKKNESDVFFKQIHKLYLEELTPVIAEKLALRFSNLKEVFVKKSALDDLVELASNWPDDQHLITIHCKDYAGLRGSEEDIYAKLLEQRLKRLEQSSNTSFGQTIAQVLGVDKLDIHWSLQSRSCLQDLQFLAQFAVINVRVFGYTGKIESWTVPQGVDKITIEAWGAQGGNSGDYQGGRGALVLGSIVVRPGDEINILVGQQGVSAGKGSGGGGGSFVVKSDDTPLLIAGGGGGSAVYRAGRMGLTSEGAGDSNIIANYGEPATGKGGGEKAKGGTQGYGGGSGCAAGGGGFLGDGADGNHQSVGGRAFINGGGGYCTRGYGNPFGGFGGGGAGSPSGYGGGGGGYSGGGGGDYNGRMGCGGGGGSYVDSSSTNIKKVAGVKRGHGQVMISWEASSS